MNEKLRLWLAKVDELSLRERGLLLFALLFALYLLWDSLLMAPLEARRAQAETRITMLRQRIAELDGQMQAVVERHALDPDKENRERRARLLAEIARLDEQLHELTVDLIGPADMARVLEEVLTRERRLKLIRLENLGVQPLFESAAGDAAGGGEPVPGVYKHGLRIEFEGGYLAMLRYLKALENLPWHFFWDRVDFQVEKYPKARVVIQVYTLSLEEGWIGV